MRAVCELQARATRARASEEHVARPANVPKLTMATQRTAARGRRSFRFPQHVPRCHSLSPPPPPPSRPCLYVPRSSLCLSLFVVGLSAQLFSGLLSRGLLSHADCSLTLFFLLTALLFSTALLGTAQLSLSLSLFFVLSAQHLSARRLLLPRARFSRQPKQRSLQRVTSHICRQIVVLNVHIVPFFSVGF